VVFWFSKENLVQKFLFSLIFLGFVFGIKSQIRTYFDEKFNETYKLVVKYGGHPYDGPRIKQHRFWHPVFCGLGDFDTKYGYKWNDRVAYRYAVPILNRKYGMHLRYSGKLHLDSYYDADSLYYVKFDEIDEYEDVVKEKVLSDILSDPLWYIKILFRRILRIFHVTAPFYWLGIPFLILLVTFYFIKEYELVILFISSLPLSFTPFVIYSGGNATLNSFFPELTVGVILCLVVKWLSDKLKFSIKTKT
jgi:hypothetical protein